MHLRRVMPSVRRVFIYYYSCDILDGQQAPLLGLEPDLLLRELLPLLQLQGPVSLIYS